MWTGGHRVLGYDHVNKKLVLNPAEAEQVLAIFALFRDLGSMMAVLEELRRRGWRQKNGTRGPYTTKALRHLLTNAVYIGKVDYDGELHDGAHEAIIDQATWDAIQAMITTPERTDYEECLACQ